MGNKVVTWIAGTVVVALVLAALGWQFGIAPLMTEASDMRSQAESEQSRVDQLEITLAGLKRDFENIDEFKLELEELRTGIPSSVEISEVTRRVTTMAETAGVVIVGSATTTAVDITPTAPAPAPSAPADGEAADAAEETDAATDTAATPPPATDVLYAVPVEFLVVGGYDPALAFITALQANERLILVSSVQLTAQEPAGAQGGRPATVDGDVEARISAWVFVLLSADGTTEVVPADGEAVQEAELPVPSGQKNPFVPQS